MTGKLRLASVSGEEKGMPKKDIDGFDRRDVLKQIAAVTGSAQLSPNVLGAAGIATVATQAAPVSAQGSPATNALIPAGYQSLSADEAAFVEAFVNVLCPADHLTPNGVDCGLATFIDRQ